MGQRVASSIAGLALAAVLGGCGGATHTGLSDVGVIRGWAQALARGDIGAASTYFATPSIVQISPDQAPATVRSEAEVRSVNLMLPCGAKLLDSRPVSGYLDALFLLTTRPGGNCGAGVGATARVAFVIHAGKIAVWRRIPDEPGDAARGAPGGPVALPPAARSV